MLEVLSAVYLHSQIPGAPWVWHYIAHYLAPQLHYNFMQNTAALVGQQEGAAIGVVDEKQQQLPHDAHEANAKRRPRRMAQHTAAVQGESCQKRAKEAEAATLLTQKPSNLGGKIY